MILSLVAEKGGCAKSSCAIAIASELHARGHRVLLVDADPQGTARVTGEVAAERGAPAPTVIAMGKDLHRPDQLPRLAQAFDHVVIDTPGRADGVQMAALLVADVALVPVGQSAADAWGITATLRLVEQAQVVRPDLRAALLITRKLPRTSLGKSAREVLEPSGLPVLATETTYRVAWQECLAAGVGVAQYAPKDRAAEEARALVDEVLAFAGVASAEVAVG